MALTKILDGGMSSGSILQVVQGSKTDTFTSNEQTNFVDIGLSVAITPSFFLSISRK